MAILFYDTLDYSPGLLTASQVCRSSSNRCASTSQVVNDSGEFGTLQVREEEMASLTNKPLGQRLTEPACRAGDQGDLPIEFSHICDPFRTIPRNSVV